MRHWQHGAIWERLALEGEAENVVLAYHTCEINGNSAPLSGVVAGV